MNNEEKSAADAGEVPGERDDGGRRDALRRLARYGAFTAPALLAILTSEKAAALTLPP